MQEFECFGYWWIPNKPNLKLPGSLKFSNEEGANLNIWGEFEDKFLDLIYGQTNNDLITLVNCQKMVVKKFYNSKVGHNNSSEYNAEIIFLGKHLKAILENLKIFKVYLDITYLSKWACLSRFEKVNDQDFMTIKPIIGEEIKVNLNNLKLSIDDSELLSIASELTVGQYCQHSIIDRGLEAKNTFYSSFILKFKPALPYRNMYDSYFIPLQGFLTFMTNKINYLVKIEIFENDNSDIPIQVFVPQIKINLNKQNNNEPEILTLIQVKNRFDTIIKSWFDLYQKMPDIMNLYLIIKYNPLLTIESKFLFFAQLLEGYHKIINIKTKFLFFAQLLESYYKTSSFDVENQNKIEEVNHFNKRKNKNGDLIFVERIYLLLLENKFMFDDLVQDTKIIFFLKNLSDKIRDNRNYYTHYFDKKCTVVTGKKLLILSKIMDILFEIIILKSFEFSEKEIIKKITNKSEYCYLKENFELLNLN